MSKKPSKLSLVPKEEEEVTHTPLKELKINSFWNTCGEHQEGFPCTVCREEKVGHFWSINSPEHNNCFWEYVRAKSFPDGFMNPLSQSQTAKIMGCSPTSIHMIEKAAIEKLKNSPYFDILVEYLTKDPEGERYSDYTISVPFSEPDDADDSEDSDDQEDEDVSDIE